LESQHIGPLIQATTKERKETHHMQKTLEELNSIARNLDPEDFDRLRAVLLEHEGYIEHRRKVREEVKKKKIENVANEQALNTFLKLTRDEKTALSSVFAVDLLGGHALLKYYIERSGITMPNTRGLVYTRKLIMDNVL
jgi:type II restriction/modification system DNA methylase subunit YeeA